MSVATQDLAAEHAALRERAGLFERTGWGLLRVQGKDRLGFLHKYVTQDVKGLIAGEGAHGCALTVKGGMVADLVLLEGAPAAGEALIVVAPAGRAPLLAHLSKYVLFDDVRFVDASEELALLALQGPRAAGVLVANAIETPGGFLAHAALPGGAGRVVHHDLGSLLGFELVLPRAAVDGLRAGLLASGAAAVSAAAAEVVRIEEGQPLFGLDMDERTIPLEAGLSERSISTTKGCYTGQEVIARILHRGHVNRRLVGFRFPAGVEPAPGPVFLAEKEVTRVTSAGTSPRLGGVGLGLLHTKYAAGSALAFGAPGGPAVTVSALPLR